MWSSIGTLHINNLMEKMLVDEAMSTDTPSFVSLAFADGVPRTALFIAVIVGSILNIINQGDALFGEMPVNTTKMVLIFMVPYCVSTYGSVTMKLRLRRQAMAEQDG